MNMWPSKTKAWGSKTRPALPKYGPVKHELKNGEATEKDYDDNYEDDVEKELTETRTNLKNIEIAIAQKDMEIDHLKRLLDTKEKELAYYRGEAQNNAKFTQNVVMELIQLKTVATVPRTITPLPASSSLSGPKGKLP